MRVLQVIPSAASVHGGPSRALAMIERALLGQGVAVETVTTDDDGPGRRNGHADGQAVREAGVTRRYFRKRSEFYKVAPSMVRWLWRNIENYDVVHIHALFSFSSTVAAWIARSRSVPYVIRPLGTLNRYGVEKRRPWLKRGSLRMVEGPLLRHAAALHFTAEAEQAEAAELGIPFRRTAVIPLGIEAEVRSSASQALLERFPALAEGTRLLFLSRLDPVKNVEGLLRAFGSIRAEAPDSWLLIAGDGEAGYVQSLKDLSIALGIDDRVLWLGQVAGEMKQAALAVADLFVLSSFSENFGIAAVEALAAGLPCVLGEGVAVAEDVANANAGLAIPPVPDAIADGVLRLLGDDPLRKRMSDNARRLAVARYSVDAMGKALVDLYEDVLRAEQGRMVKGDKDIHRDDWRGG